MLSFIVRTAANSVNPGDVAVRIVSEFRDTMYRHDVDDDELYRKFQKTQADLKNLELPERDQLFWLSQASHYMARGYQSLDTVEEVLSQDSKLREGKFKKLQKDYPRLNEIIALYEESISLAEEYLQGGRDARGVRLYAESLSQLSTLKTLGFLMINGPKVVPLAEEAVALNSREVKAHIILAARYVYSPSIWGGDSDRGIAMMESISLAGETDREDKHKIAIGIGFAHTMAERWDLAIPFFQEALDIYPGNVFAMAMIRLCESRTSQKSELGQP